jgi:hypothetical protein
MAEARASELARALDERIAESNRVIAEVRYEMNAQLAAGILFCFFILVFIFGSILVLF